MRAYRSESPNNEFIPRVGEMQQSRHLMLSRAEPLPVAFICTRLSRLAAEKFQEWL
jgi:hypothetical protein